MTEQEQDVLKEIRKIEDILKEYEKDGGSNLRIYDDTIKQLNVILSKLKEAYPTVRFPTIIPNCCGAPIRDFLGDLLPVFARLSKQEATTVDEKNDVSTENIETEIKVEEVPEPTKKTPTKRRKK
ncbi:hypothetical protein [Sphingobacterium multivorum]|uniref:hypothetical protein n=1 Tax=Sphingobacterium multivorum TaxID=28454 RepID=UPI00289B544C|nr:hypothetical protein [Sphingobacterium multivorum]